MREGLLPDGVTLVVVTGRQPGAALGAAVGCARKKQLESAGGAAPLAKEEFGSRHGGQRLL